MKALCPAAYTVRLCVVIYCQWLLTRLMFCVLQEVPREYAGIITKFWHDDPSARPEFSELLRPFVELHDIFSPGESGITRGRLSMSATSLAPYSWLWWICR